MNSAKTQKSVKAEESSLLKRAICTKGFGSMMRRMALVDSSCMTARCTKVILKTVFTTERDCFAAPKALFIRVNGKTTNATGKVSKDLKTDRYFMEISKMVNKNGHGHYEWLDGKEYKGKVKNI